MNVSTLLSSDAPRPYRSPQTSDTALHTALPDQQHVHQYPTRRSVSSNAHTTDHQNPAIEHSRGFHTTASGNQPSAASPVPKTVTFELLFDGAANYRARLPLKVQIFPHDTTDSIVTTVKNFYGLYEGYAAGFNFEDSYGSILIARYENFRNDMSVYVRVALDNTQTAHHHGRQPYLSASPQIGHNSSQLVEGFQMPPPQQALNYGQPYSRPNSRIARKRSASPRTTRVGRAPSTQKGRSRSGIKSTDVSVAGSFEDGNYDAANGYSSSDGGAGSVSGSRKARSEQFARAEISLENVVEGGRRKRAKFESSVSARPTMVASCSVSVLTHLVLQELPLFVPPQVPITNSISSISPQRRSNGQDNQSPFARPAQRTPQYNQPLQSPQSYGFGEHLHGVIPISAGPYSMPAPTQHGHRLRDRPALPPTASRSSTGSLPHKQALGILPTPDPTVASCISDEDVALQLMRLGDASNISHGRTSASTLDDRLSGRADVASSADSYSDEESEGVEHFQHALPQLQPKFEHLPGTTQGPSKKHYKQLNDGLPSVNSTEPSGDEIDGDYSYDDKRDGIYEHNADGLAIEYRQPGLGRAHGPRSTHSGIQKVRSGGSTKKSSKVTKRPSVPKKAKPAFSSNEPNVPMSPVSSVAQSRKTSSASTFNFQHHLGVDEEDLSSKPRCQRCRKSKKGCDRQRPCQRCKDAGIGIEGCISEDEGNGRKGRFGRHMGVSVKKDLEEGTQPDDESEVAGAILTGMATSPDKSKKRKR